MPPVEPSRYKRRSFVYRRLLDAGATFAEIDDAAVADSFPGRGGLPGHLALIDLSPLPRQGYKGPDTMTWLGAQGLTAPKVNNRAQIQNGGAILARLGDNEALLLPDPAKSNPAAMPTREPQAGMGCYPVPRRDSHAWFLLTGRLAEPCLRKLCGADLRRERFPDLSVAQTSVARLPAIVIRRDIGETPGYHLLADSAAALYFWDALIDAMSEFKGAAAGVRALRALVHGA